MPENPIQPCDVVGCSQPGSGSYLAASDTRVLRFAVCDEHLSRLQAGARPTVVAERLDLSRLDALPALLLPSPEGDD